MLSDEFPTVRAQRHIVGSLAGHSGEICGLRWALSGRQLASSGNDRLVHIWDSSLTHSRSASVSVTTSEFYSGSNSRSQAKGPCLHQWENPRATVKALAWCPFQACSACFMDLAVSWVDQSKHKLCLLVTFRAI